MPDSPNVHTLFERIVAGDIPCDKVYEDDELLAFRDIAPASPTHILLIPKRKIVNLLHANDQDAPLLGKMLITAQLIAKQQNLTGFRLVINNGEAVGQTVFHLHMHILGGRDFAWPPG